MQISTSAYMSVETLVRLAAQSADTPCTTRGLAEWINRSVSYTEGLMARLRKAGLVVSRHGPGGGYILARPADRITVAEVVQAVDEPRAPPVTGAEEAAATRSLADPAVLQGSDLLRHALKDHVLVFLNGVSLADLAADGDRPVDFTVADATAPGDDRRSVVQH